MSIKKNLNEYSEHNKQRKQLFSVIDVKGEKQDELSEQLSAYFVAHLNSIEMNKLPKTALNLKQFMLRQEVLKLYREIFRTIRLVPDKCNQRELRDWARHDFRTHSGQTDEMAIKMMLQYGRRSLTELQTSLELSGSSNDKGKSVLAEASQKAHSEEIKS